MNKECSNELIREYDGLVGLTLLNIHTISQEKGIIRLYHFDRKNKEHLFVLRMALTARDIYQFPVEVEASWFDIIRINKAIEKGFRKVKRYKPLKGYNKEKLYAHGGIAVPEILDFMRPDGIRRVGENFNFGDIYDLYYEGSCN